MEFVVHVVVKASVRGEPNVAGIDGMNANGWACVHKGIPLYVNGMNDGGYEGRDE
jgi:hypothetical protein